LAESFALMDLWFTPLVWVAAGLFAVLYWKGIPGVFHLRLAVACIQGAVFEGRLRKIDDHVIMTERVMLCDMDVNLHQNNSIYNLVADISRYHWISRLVSGNVGRLASVKIANGGVSMYFLKEIGFLKRYSVATYCMGMDQKWWCVASRRSYSRWLVAQRSPAAAPRPRWRQHRAYRNCCAARAGRGSSPAVPKAPMLLRRANPEQARAMQRAPGQARERAYVMQTMAGQAREQAQWRVKLRQPGRH
jgi:hypothetical protein